MAVGDLKGTNPIIIKVTAGAAATVGQVVHLEDDDGYWDPVVAGDTGKFGVALDAATAEGDSIRVLVWGAVEVKATAAAIAKGAHVIAGSTGLIAQAENMATFDAPETYSEEGVQTELDKIIDHRLVVGTVMGAFESSGTGTLFVGMM